MSKVVRRRPGVFGNIGRQVEFGVAKALTTVAKAAQGKVEASLPNRFDRPNSFTQRGIAIQAARKGALKAAVFVRPLQARYLRIEEGGGTRRPERRALVIPVGAGLNAYGNLPAKALQRLKGRRDVFVGQITFRSSGETIGGVWQRPKSGERRDGSRGTKGRLNAGSKSMTGLKLLVRFVGEASYEPRFGFRETVYTTVKALLTEAVAREITAAIRGAGL
ncbi:hypothetical protein [Zavarzinia sp.]|uniref:hypothetical protein n=1 Tax=Zavarzinia sp. TaxID=2027920 RepID=UPI003BB6EE75